MQDFHIAGGMSSVGPKLKALRLSARPSLSIRKMADALDMPSPSYHFYEREQAYKKPHLPLDFARKVAAVLSRYGVEPEKVMALAGLTVDEVLPEAQRIEAERPSTRYVSLPVALPNEDALSDMFEAILAIVPPNANRAEVAQILARRLPTGLAAIGPFAPDQNNSDVPESLTRNYSI